ncbi:MAG: hypothetical protein LUF27_15265 [Lachnospiraceae bacterium]|nr:hypothetical protein [Lachnospiraceae bacterium]
MSSGPKIMVFKLREIVYTLILAFFVITLLLCLILMFTKKSSGDAGEAQTNTNVTQSTGTEQENTNGILNSEAAQSNSDETQTQSNSTEAQMQGNSAETQTQNGSDITETASVEANPTSVSGSSPYIAGVYTSSVRLGDAEADVQVTVSSDRILAIELVNLSEATEAAYPLVPSALENLASQILEKQKLDGITCSAQTRYTSQLLFNAVSKALSVAKATESS